MEGLFGRVKSVEQDVARLTETTDTLRLAGAHPDACEIRISGIPGQFLTDEQLMDTAVRDVLSAMGCSGAAKYLYRTRVFAAKGAAPGTGAVAAQFTCVAARDDALRSSRKLKGQTSTKLFGKGGDAGIFVNSILPAPVYKLAVASRTRAQDLHYPPPLVNSSGVFMRRSLRGPLIPITLLSDLDHLQPIEPSGRQ